MSNNQQQDKRTASQRIDDMERGLMALYQTADGMSRDLQTIKEAIKLLGNKLDSVVKASRAGETLTDEVIARIMVENNVEELKEKVSEYVANGVLVPAEEATPLSFIVGRELGDDGTVQNPRTQFLVNALNPEIRGSFPGKKVGEVIVVQEGKWRFEIQEIYNIAQPLVPQQPAAQEPTEPTQAES